MTLKDKKHRDVVMKLAKKRTQVRARFLIIILCSLFPVSEAALFFWCLLFPVTPSWAEKGEAAIGLHAGVLFPALKPTSTTAFTLATWSAGVVGEYGLLDDLSLAARFTFSMFDGDADGYTYEEDGLEYIGLLRCSVRVYHPQVGLKYKLYAGYNLAPYLEASFGYAWTTFHDPQLVNEEGLVYDVGIYDFAEGSLTLTVGVSADYRLFNMVFVGVGFYFTYMDRDGLLEHYFSVPVIATYYW